MKLNIAGKLGSALKIADPQTFLGYNEAGDICGCFLGGAVLAVTEPTEWPELARNPALFMQVLGEKFPGAPVDDITSWYIDVIYGYMAPEEMEARIEALEPVTVDELICA